MNPSPTKKWFWDNQQNSHVEDLLIDASIDPAWRHRLEKSADDPLVGKLLCVCAAIGIARTVFPPESPSDARAALEILESWVDNPTTDSFGILCRLIFDDTVGNTGNDLPEAVWWAIRTATSSVGNYEASWALSGAWDAAVRAGASSALLGRAIQDALLSRRNTGK
jgi:hypothetical protein